MEYKSDEFFETAWIYFIRGVFVTVVVVVAFKLPKLPENSRDQNLTFRKFQPEKRLPKILVDLFRVKIR